MRPGFTSQSKNYNAPRDGRLFHRAGMTGPQAYLNAAVLPGWQRWMPTYRIAAVLSLDDDLNTASVQLAEEVSSAQSLPINPAGGAVLADVPVEYMECGTKAFREGDRVVVEYPDRTWESPKVIGFEKEPRECTQLVIEFRFWSDVAGRTETLSIPGKCANAVRTRCDPEWVTSAVTFSEFLQRYFQIYIDNRDRRPSTTTYPAYEWIESPGDMILEGFPRVAPTVPDTDPTYVKLVTQEMPHGRSFNTSFGVHPHDPTEILGGFGANFTTPEITRKIGSVIRTADIRNGTLDAEFCLVDGGTVQDAGYPIISGQTVADNRIGGPEGWSFAGALIAEAALEQIFKMPPGSTITQTRIAMTNYLLTSAAMPVFIAQSVTTGRRYELTFERVVSYSGVHPWRLRYRLSRRLPDE